MSNVKMKRDCHIGTVCFPAGTVHDPKKIEALYAGRAALWVDVGLAIETDEPVTKGVASKVVKAMNDEVAEAEAEATRRKEVQTAAKKAKAAAKPKTAARKTAAKKKE